MAPDRTSLEIALGYLHALGGDDPEVVADLVAVDFLNEHQAELGGGCVGRDEYRRRLPGFFAGFPNRHYEVVETVVQLATDRSGSTPTSDSDEVVVRYRFGADVGDHRIDIPGVMWISVRDGDIVRRLDTWDSLTYFRQTETDPPRFEPG